MTNIPIEYRSVTVRELRLFFLGPVLICILVGLAAHFFPWQTPMPGMLSLLAPAPMAILISAGAIGIALVPIVDLPATPALIDSAVWRAMLISCVLPGVLAGGLMLAIDDPFHLSSTVAQGLGVTWINVALPGSILHYAAGSVLLECLFRLAPIPLFMFVLGTLPMRGRHQGAIFWAIAILTSLIEPYQQIGSTYSPDQAVQVHLVLGGLVIWIFGFNLLEAWEFKRYGWPAPILFRVGFYAAYHVFGPYMLSPTSVLYPGPH